jgi:hypothetical protein
LESDGKKERISYYEKMFENVIEENSQMISLPAKPKSRKRRFCPRKSIKTKIEKYI